MPSITKARQTSRKAGLGGTYPRREGEIPPSAPPRASSPVPGLLRPRLGRRRFGQHRARCGSRGLSVRPAHGPGRRQRAAMGRTTPSRDGTDSAGMLLGDAAPPAPSVCPPGSRPAATGRENAPLCSQRCRRPSGSAGKSRSHRRSPALPRRACR